MTIVIASLMLIAAITITVLSTQGKKETPSPEGEEIVFKPEVVETEEGSATLKIVYNSSEVGFRSQGAEDISISILYDLDNIRVFTVQGFHTSTQRVDIGAQDQGRDCWFNILHQVEYNVSGTFDSEACTFQLYVGMTPTSSKLLSTDCSFDPGLPVNQFYMAPQPDAVVFTSPIPNPHASAQEYSFTLGGVALPSDVSCPAFGP